MKTIKNINFSKIIIITLVLIITALSAIALTGGDYQKGQKPNTLITIINDGTGTIDELFTRPVSYLQEKASAFQNVLDAYNQNENLKKQLSALAEQEQQLNSALQENRELKNALKLQNTLSDYTTANANVISRNPSSWNNLLIIDKGTNAGLSVNMPVMANGGIIGRISQVNASSSKVELLTKSGGLTNKISVRITNGSATTYGLLTKFDSNLGTYVVTNIQGSEVTSNGSKVESTGFNEHIPSNLLFGTVAGIKKGSLVYSDEIYVKPSYTDSNYMFVTVIIGQK